MDKRTTFRFLVMGVITCVAVLNFFLLWRTETELLVDNTLECKQIDTVGSYYQFVKNYHSEFTRQMQGLMKLRENRKIFTASRSFTEYAPNWLTTLPWIVCLHPEFFHFSESTEAEYFELFLTQKCSVHSGVKVAQLGALQPIFGKRTQIPLHNATLNCSSKVHTAMMCRLMSTSSLQCPLTYIVRANFNEIPLFLRESLHFDNNTLWAYKLDAQSGGADILITSRVDEVRQRALSNILHSNTLLGTIGEGGVIQKIVSPALLVKGRRFSLRMYCAITHLDQLHFYFSEDFFGIHLASEAKGQALSPNQIISNFHYQTDMNYMRAFEFVEYLQTEGLLTKWKLDTLPRIGEGLKEFFKYESLLKPEQLSHNHFELFGCDIILDIDMNPFLLECNRCAGISGSIKDHLVLFEELLYIALYEHETSSHPNDTLHWVYL
uniref:Tubulin-tyrosine ligase n=1 Tax=Vannella robusta TaxID=1487602 RepID=A0A7S4I7F0_9EUKA|mmetsp:Transcript_21503/g.27348  ORF Transcript_21503/g.27348 Transcript_21503/m.27348 type:complete len:436 (+) Transcript_21503:40-1347(+)